MPAPISIAIRGVSADTLAQFRRGAAMRGSSQAQYLAALVELHARMRALADTPTADGRWEQVAAELVWSPLLLLIPFSKVSRNR